MLEGLLIIIAVIGGVFIGTYLERKTSNRLWAFLQELPEREKQRNLEVIDALSAMSKNQIDGVHSLADKFTSSLSEALKFSSDTGKILQESLSEAHKFSENIGHILKGVAQQAHNQTIRSIAHVQPATIDVIKAQNVNDDAEKNIKTWETEQNQPDIPDASVLGPREFVAQMEAVLAAGGKE